MRTRWRAALRLAVVGALLSGSAIAADDLVLEVGYSAQLFLEVDESDARAATQVWIAQLMDRLGRTEDSETYIVHGAADAVQGVRDTRLDILVLLPTEYLEVQDRIDMVPTLVPIIHGKPGYNYGLLCRTGADLDSLRGRELLVASAHAPELPRLWLDRLLGDSGRPRAATWFANVRHVDRLASAVLPVLFGDAAACVVTLGGFDTMREMNPQLGRDLQVLAVSQLLSPAVICVRPDIQAEFGDLLDAGMRSLHKEPEGRQILGLFGIERLVAFDDSHLDPVRELLELAAGIDGRPTP